MSMFWKINTFLVIDFVYKGGEGGQTLNEGTSFRKVSIILRRSLRRNQFVTLVFVNLLFYKLRSSSSSIYFGLFMIRRTKFPVLFHFGIMHKIDHSNFDVGFLYLLNLSPNWIFNVIWAKKKLIILCYF